MDTDNRLGPHQVILHKWIDCAPFEKMLGIEIISANEGKAELTMPFLAASANGGSMLHGGALVTLADTAAVMAIKSVVPAGTHFGTTHMEVDFLHPVLQGIVTARSSVTEVQERLWDAVVELLDSDGRKVMQMQATFKISRRRLNENLKID
ncbi:MAG: PaaI family thioesterase [Desulfuromonas sp.]|nr:PaaI family thioesterase [Desulfuromonas sp.]